MSRRTKNTNKVDAIGDGAQMEEYGCTKEEVMVLLPAKYLGTTIPNHASGAKTRKHKLTVQELDIIEDEVVVVEE